MAQFDRIYQYKSIFSRKAFVPKLELLSTTTKLSTTGMKTHIS